MKSVWCLVAFLLCLMSGSAMAGPASGSVRSKTGAIMPKRAVAYVVRDDEGVAPARIEVLLRRTARSTPVQGSAQTLSLGELHVDMARRRATRAGQRLELSAKEFQLLTLLIRRQGEVLSRTEIAEQVWDVNFDHGTNVIDVAVRRLRGKLDKPFDHPLLHTVRGMGYVLEDRKA